MSPGLAIAEVSARHPRAAALVGLTIGGVVAKGAVSGDPRAWPYAIVLTVVTAAVAMVAAGGRLSGRVVGGFAALAACHAVGGLALAPGTDDVSLYEHWIVDGVLKFDQAVHAAGTALITVAMAELLACWLRPEARRLRWVLAALLACGIGALNEVFEFVMAQRIETLRIGDGANTGWDLVFNLVGAAAVVAFAALAGPDRADDAEVRDASYAGRSVG